VFRCLSTYTTAYRLVVYTPLTADHVRASCFLNSTSSFNAFEGLILSWTIFACMSFASQEEHRRCFTAKHSDWHCISVWEAGWQDATVAGDIADREEWVSAFLWASSSDRALPKTARNSIPRSSKNFFFYIWWRQLAAGRSLNCASCPGGWGERSCPGSATAIHSVLWIEHPTFQLGGGHLTTELLPPQKLVTYICRTKDQQQSCLEQQLSCSGQL